MSGTNARGTTQTQRLNAPLGTLDTTTPKPDKSLMRLTAGGAVMNGFVAGAYGRRSALLLVAPDLDSFKANT